LRLATACLLAATLAVVLTPIVAANPPPENIITDPYGTFRSAFGSWADVVIFGIFMAGVVLVYIKTQSVAPPLMIFIIGCMALGVLFPADTMIQKSMFILAVVGLVGMVYYAFVSSRWE
jgi:hypothetical protein